MVVVDKLKKKGTKGFLNSYKESTRKVYLSTLRKYFGFVYPELGETYPKNRAYADEFEVFDEKMDELSLAYVKKPENEFEAHVVSFREEILGSKAPKTIAGSMAAIFKYLAVNDLEFTKDFKKKIVGVQDDSGISKEKVPTPDELSRIVYNLPPQGRALALALASGGMRVDEALQLKISDVELDYVASYLGEDRKQKDVAIPKISLRAETTKSGKARIVFISQEARAELVKWLDNRAQYLQKIKKATGRNPDEDLIFPFSYATFKDMWIVALRKTGLLEKDVVTNRITLRIHNIRKFFRTWGGWSNPDIAEALLGHKKGIQAIYNRKDQAERLLVEGYKEAEANLTLNKGQVFEAPSQELTDLKSWNRQLLAETEIGREERKELRKDIADLKEMVEGLSAYGELMEAILADKDISKVVQNLRPGVSTHKGKAPAYLNEA
jgi:integrase